jgi:hypothetical protein
MLAAMSNLKLDFVVYLGDPEENAKAVPSSQAVQKADEYKQQLNFNEGVYCAIVVEKNKKELGERMPDPGIQLLTTFLRAIPFLIDGEPENALLSESEYGFSFEPSGDDILLSCFKGDAYEPDEYLIEREPIPLEAFAEQTIAMGERLVSLIKKLEPDHLTNDDYAKTMLEFLDMAKSRFRTFRLERERGIRR